MIAAATDLNDLPWSFTTAEAEDAGVTRWRLYRLAERGEVASLSRGVWRRVDAPEIAHLDLLTVAKRAPHGAACLISALAYWDLVDLIPEHVDLAVPRGTHRPQIDWPPTDVHVFDADTFEVGVVTVDLSEQEQIRVTDPVRSVTDALRLRGQIGSDIAFAATRELLERERAAGRRVLEMARLLRCEGPARETLEVLQA